MTETLRPGLCVIGNTAGGRALAARAAARGMPTVLVDRGETDVRPVLGTLLAIASDVAALRALGAAGLVEGADAVAVDHRAVARVLRERLAALSPARMRERLTAQGVAVIADAAARFADRRTILAGGRRIVAPRIVVSCGETPLAVAIDGLQAVEALSPATLLAGWRRHQRLVVCGDGPDALALAQACGRLGARTTLVASGAFLPDEDPELAAVVLRRMAREGIGLDPEADAIWVERRGKTGIRLGFRRDGVDRSVEAGQLVVVAPSAPDLAGLDPAAGGLRLAGGAIAVDDALATANRRVHAIGTAAGADPRTDAERHHAEIVGDALLERRARPLPLLPRRVRTGPELARIGLTEAAARAAGVAPRVHRLPFAAVDDERPAAEGHVKLVLDRRARILGVTAAGDGAAAAVEPFAAAMARGESFAAVAALPLAPGSAAQIGKRAALAYLAGDARRGAARGLWRLLKTRP